MSKICKNVEIMEEYEGNMTLFMKKYEGICGKYEGI